MEYIEQTYFPTHSSYNFGEEELEEWKIGHIITNWYKIDSDTELLPF